MRFTWDTNSTKNIKELVLCRCSLKEHAVAGVPNGVRDLTDHTH
jgi:hypothetical protein